jgi:hypothetical protein
VRVVVTQEGELYASLSGLAPRVKEALRVRMEELVDEIYAKVEENLGGGLLQQKSGALAASIQHGVTEQGDTLIGFVTPEPQDAKALALELGGSGYYNILPSKGRLLRFIAKDGATVYASSVLHPPSRAFRYLGTAFDEIVSKVGPELAAAAARAMRA